MIASVRGWINYYGKFYRSGLYSTLQSLNFAIVRWVVRKYKRFKGSLKRLSRTVLWDGGIDIMSIPPSHRHKK